MVDFGERRYTKMDLQTSKSLGGVGALLLVIGPLASIGNGYGAFLDLIGLILVLVALKGLADYYREGGIFNNAIYGVITGIVGVVVLGLLVILVLVNAFTSIPGWPPNWSDPNAVSTFFTSFFSDPANYGKIFEIAAGALLSWVIFIVFLSVAGYFTWRSYGTLRTKSGVSLFGTAGLLIFVGAILTIVLIGLLLIWIAEILLIVAFFQLRPQAQPQQIAPPQPQ